MAKESLANKQFVVKQIKVQELRKKKITSTIKVFLCVKDNQTGIVYPHPLSNFIKAKYERKSKELTTQKSVAEEIKKFLNYIIDCIEDEEELFLPLQEKGIKALQLIHGANYISYLTHRAKSGEISGNYVYRIERFLIQFYKWLSEQKIIDEAIDYREEKRVRNNKVEVYLISPFNNSELGTEYPPKDNNGIDRLHDFGMKRLDLINLFLKVAKLEAPDIALGIAFQFYGGLRRGEVVNLLRSSMNEPKTNGAGEFTLNIDDNWQQLFPNKKTHDFEQVKNPRIQAIIKVPIVLELLEAHKKNLKRLEKNSKLKNTKALFISNYTGMPVTGSAYWWKFTKVKEKFLEIVVENDIEDYQYLISKSWGTHIGRGIYTNMLLFTLGWNLSETAIARGDKRINSSQDYAEKKNVEILTENAVEQLALIASGYENKKRNTIVELRDI